MKRRLKELKPDEIVAVKEAANMRGIEKILHKRYKHRRIPQTEYFRLSEEEVEEAAFLLGAESGIHYKPSAEAKRESETCAEIGNNHPEFKLTPYIKDLLESLEDLLIEQLGFDGLYKEGTDSYTGATGNVVELIYQTDNADPDIKVPVSEDLRQACLRVMNRDDVFLPIVQAGTEVEAAQEVERITRDFSLIYLWGSKQGMFNITLVNSSEKHYREMLSVMESICRKGNVWYTQKTESSSFWIIVLISVIAAFIFPLLGIPVLALVVIFRKRLQASFK